MPSSRTGTSPTMRRRRRSVRARRGTRGAPSPRASPRCPRKAVSLSRLVDAPVPRLVRSPLRRRLPAHHQITRPEPEEHPQVRSPIPRHGPEANRATKHARLINPRNDQTSNQRPSLYKSQNTRSIFPCSEIFLIQETTQRLSLTALRDQGEPPEQRTAHRFRRLQAREPATPQPVPGLPELSSSSPLIKTCARNHPRQGRLRQEGVPGIAPVLVASRPTPTGER